MHTNSHKKDELCIKTYFLHKKSLYACRVGEE
nr:MAG TPA: GURMARIN-TASTE, SUPPRESSING PROTEIN, SWEET TASTE-SUPPRESSING [Caudoviricetes sp.]